MKAIWYSLLFLGYKPVQYVTVLNTTGNYNILLNTCVSNHRKDTVRIWYKSVRVHLQDKVRAVDGTTLEGE